MLGLLIVAMLANTGIEAKTEGDNVVRCVREQVTGSLASGRRVCHTVAEWRRIRRDSNDEVRRVFDSSVGRPAESN